MMIQVEHFYVGRILFLSLCLCQRGALQNVPPPGLPLGMESGAIRDSSLTASYVHPGLGPERARLHTGSAWYGGGSSTQQWIQVDLSTTYRITGVATQGRQNINQWVTSFTVACSIDGITFDIVQDTLNEPITDKVFAGNTDANTVVYNTLPSVKVCQYVRLLPIRYHAAPMLRIELYGEGPVRDGDVRLVGGTSDSEGRVEVWYNGQWGTVCDDAWDTNDASVVCRSLGFAGALEAVSSAGFGQGTGTIVLDDVNCSGDESSLFECSNPGLGVNNCGHSEDAGVRCQELEGGEVRLVGGTSDSEGRVEVSYNGQWGTVCDDGWDSNDASVVCRSLGFAGALEAVSSAGFGQGTGTIVLDDVNCSGNESSIFECSNQGLGVNNCGHSDDAGVRCLVPKDGEVRLVGGTSYSEGRVEVSYNGEWGTVCDDAWDTNDASVVCRSLGFAGSLEAVSSAVFGQGNGTIVLDDVNCYGNESSLFECSNQGLGVNNCGHSEHAGVRCIGPEDGKVRLVGGTSDFEGRVEVSYNGEWGTVCDDAWYTNDASVVCRSLGFAGALEAVSSAGFGQGTGTIVLDDVNCSGNESSLFECSNPGLGVNNCGHSEDAGVRCLVPEVRLVGGTSDSEGRVEVSYNGEWGTVCDYPWDTNDSSVVCRSLGFTGSLEAVSSAVFGQGNGTIVLDDVNCFGNESSLFECSNLGLGVNNCGHSEGAGVRCLVPEDGEVRLVGGTSNSEGRVEVWYNGEWGTVCDDFWDTNDASVVCRSLGFAGSLEAVSSARYGQGTGTIVLDDVNCFGNESSLFECSNLGLGVNNCVHLEDAGVHCLVLEDGKVRLVGGTSDFEGRVEVSYNGEWGTVCDYAWDTNDASVVCRSLGFAGALEAVSSAGFGQGTGTIVLDDVNCSGNESSLFECSNLGVGVNNCGHSEDAGVRCLVPKVRLVEGPCESEGRVEVYQHGSWGPVCDDNFTVADATIVCQMLGLQVVELLDWNVPPSAVSSYSATLKNPWCSGNETDIRYCMQEPNATCNKYAAVKCSDPLILCVGSIDGEVRLVGGTSDSEGRVEVSYNGEWGTVCDDAWETNDASVVCRSLGFAGALEAVSLAGFGKGTGTIVLDDVNCSGNESSLFECSNQGLGVNNCGHSEDAGVRCLVLEDGYSDDSSFLLSSDVETTTRQPLQKISTQTMTTATTLSPIKGALDKILNENITEDNLDVVSVELANVTEDSNKFDVEDLQSVTDKLSSIVEFASNQNLTEETIVKVSMSVIGAVDNILNIPESTFETASSQQVSKTQNILTTISTLTENIQKASTRNFTYSGSNIVLAAVKVDRKKFPLTTAIGGAMDDVIDFSANEGSPSNAAGVTSVSLPEAILPSESSTNQVISVSVFLLNSPKLFQGNRPSSSSTPSSGDKQNQQPKAVSVVASPILTVTIEGTDIKDLPDNESIVFVFPVNQTLIREENDAEVSQRCVYWDIDLGEWSDEGCRTEKRALEGMVSCRCSHLTSFAVLLDIKGSIISKALDVISRIGCIASIVCLVITLCILLGFRKLRRKQPQQILINLSFALLALYVTFVIGIDRPTWRISCTVVAILLHYFCLASLAWMGVESFNMYMMFVRVLNSYIPKFLLKCSMIGWGIPLVVVIITVASKWTAYQNYEYCFILPGYSLYFGLILPIGLILSFNGIIFAMVLYKLSCGRISTSKSSTLESKKENIVKARMEAIRRAQNVVAIGTLMGLTWAFGFLSFGGGRYLFNALFSIFNSLQGVFVFLLFGMRQPELREKLKITKKRFLHGASSARRRSSEFWASSSGARMTQRPSDVTFISTGKTDSVTEGQASTYFENTLGTGPALNKESNDTLL